MLRPVTLLRHRVSYGRWLGFLTRQRWLDPATEPGIRATPKRVRAYVGELQALNAPGTVLVRLQSLAVMLGWLAPTRDWSWLRPRKGSSPAASGSGAGRCTVPVR